MGDLGVRKPLLEIVHARWKHGHCVAHGWGNSEHGFVRGTDMRWMGDGALTLLEEEDVEFGPEQLVARLPVSWAESGERATLLYALPPSLQPLLPQPSQLSD